MAGKRPGELYGSSQLVKRQKSDANINGNRSIAVVNNSAANGALIQAVCLTVCDHIQSSHSAKAGSYEGDGWLMDGLDRYRAQVACMPR